MADDGTGCMVVGFVLIVVGAFFLGDSNGSRQGREEGRCKERWQYQHTPADSLATIRSGCPIPTPEQP